MKFTLPDRIPKNAKIINAIVALYRFSGDDASAQYEDFQLTAISELWNAETISWNAMPVYLPHLIVDESSGKTNNTWITLNATDKIQEFILAPEKNFGFMFETYFEARWMKVYSSEHEDIALRPKLMITYDDDPVSLSKALRKSHNNLEILKLGNTIKVKLPFSDPTTISIVSLNGKKLFSDSFTTNTYSLTHDVFPSNGSYIIQISQNKTSIHKVYTQIAY